MFGPDSIWSGQGIRPIFTSPSVDPQSLGPGRFRPKATVGPVRAERSAGLGLPLDVYRRNDEIWIHADLPGVPPGSIEVSIEAGILTVAARRLLHHESADRLYLTERPRGSVRRSVRLGPDCAVDDVEADYHDGVLTIRVPLAEHARSRRIPVAPGRSQAIDVESSIVDMAERTEPDEDR